MTSTLFVVQACLGALLLLPPLAMLACFGRERKQERRFEYIRPDFGTCLWFSVLVLAIYAAIAFIWPMLGGHVHVRTASMHLEEVTELLKEALLLAFVSNIQDRLKRQPMIFTAALLYSTVLFTLLFQFMPSGSFTFLLHEGSPMAACLVCTVLFGLVLKFSELPVQCLASLLLLICCHLGSVIVFDVRLELHHAYYCWLLALGE